MKKILKWIEKHKKITTVFIALLIFVPIILIHILFLLPAPCYWLDAKWEAGDILGYFGDVLSFLGSVVLGYIAIKQAEKANLISEKLMVLDLAKSKPCLDFVNMQKYKYILLSKGDKYKIEERDNRNQLMTLDLLSVSNPRSGISTNIGFVELKVTNSGHSDIRFIYINKVVFQLGCSVKMNEIVPTLSGNTHLKVGEVKTLLLYVRKELAEGEVASNIKNEIDIKNIMPYMEMDLHLVTIEGVDYYETIEVGTNWNYVMRNNENVVERELVVLNINVSTKK